MHEPLRITIDEIVEKPNPPRRHRGYPRVVKRHFAKYHRIKRKSDHGGHYTEPPKIHIFAVRAS